MNNKPASRYIPPHLRNRQQQDRSDNHHQQQQQQYSAPRTNGWNDWNGGRSQQRPGGGGGWNSSYSDMPRGGNRQGRSDFYERGSYGGYRNNRQDSGYQRRDESQGYWRDGVHHIGNRNPRTERELFGTPDDAITQHTGINFEKYDDIPVEATGNDVPQPITSFTSPPMDAHLLSNIELARYTTPTPVQKYSIPIVDAGRDLMACAQTGSGKTAAFLIPTCSALFGNAAKLISRAAPYEMNRFKCRPLILILSPTRELCTQIFDESRRVRYFVP